MANDSSLSSWFFFLTGTTSLDAQMYPRGQRFLFILGEVKKIYCTSRPVDRIYLEHTYPSLYCFLRGQANDSRYVNGSIDLTNVHERVKLTMEFIIYSENEHLLIKNITIHLASEKFSFIIIIAEITLTFTVSIL